MEISAGALFVVDRPIPEFGSLDLGGDCCAESGDDLFRIYTKWRIIAACCGDTVVLAADPQCVFFVGEFCGRGLFPPARGELPFNAFDVGKQHRDRCNFYKRSLFYLKSKLIPAASNPYPMSYPQTFPPEKEISP